MDIYLSAQSNRMNEIMKTLTVAATILGALTLIAGIYGMNFRHMPEIEWRLGYLFAWGLMAATAAGMALYFKRRDWW
jgi:magnesium transporter